MGTGHVESGPRGAQHRALFDCGDAVPPFTLTIPQRLGRQAPRSSFPGPRSVRLTWPPSSCIAPTGVEDKESWHGKPLPQNMADQVIQEIHSQIQSKKKILATPPQEDAPSVDITNIRMPTPPSYKVGDKVESGLAFPD